MKWLPFGIEQLLTGGLASVNDVQQLSRWLSAMARLVSRAAAQLEEQPMSESDDDLEADGSEAGRDDSEYPQHGLHLNIVGNSADGGHAPDEGVPPGSSATRTGGQTTMASSTEP